MHSDGTVARWLNGLSGCRITFQACAFIWDVTQRTLLVGYRRFGKACRSMFKGKAVQEETLTTEDLIGIHQYQISPEHQISSKSCVTLMIKHIGG